MAGRAAACGGVRVRRRVENCSETFGGGDVVQNGSDWTDFSINVVPENFHKPQRGVGTLNSVGFPETLYLEG